MRQGNEAALLDIAKVRYFPATLHWISGAPCLRIFGLDHRHNIDNIAQPGISAPEDVSGVAVFQSGGYLFSVTVGRLIKRKPVTCSAYQEISFVAKQMAREGVGAVVVVNTKNKPMGIVTESDMTDRVLAAGKTGAEPIRTVMSAPVICVAPEEPCFNALLKMVRFHCHHVCVVVGQMLLGVISQHDLMALQGSDPLAIINDIERQMTVEGLAGSVEKLNRIVGRLLNAGVPITQATRFISDCNDRLTRRIIVLAQETLCDNGLGSPPVTYCWLAMGSEGRMEQTLRTDQDNAIIYADPEPGSRDSVKAYFLELGHWVVSALERCGFPLCNGGIMANNPRWCQPETAWRRYFSQWINKASPKDLRHCTIFFDFRPLAGASDLAQELRQFLNNEVGHNRAFMRHLTTNALFNGPPLGFLKTLVVDKSGPYKDHLNLKMSGLVPIVDALRVFALSEYIDETNTFDRLELVHQKHLLSDELVADIKEAFGLIILLRIKQHLQQREQGVEAHDYLDPKGLSKLQRKSLIEAFRVIRDLQGELEARFPETP